MPLSASTSVWFNANLPQTLFLAQMLMYLQGGLQVVFGLLLGRGVSGVFGAALLYVVYWLLDGPGKLVAAFGIANLRRWGFWLGVTAAAAPLVVRVVAAILLRRLRPLTLNPIGLMFDIALLALLLHAQSRSHVRHWPR